MGSFDRTHHERHRERARERRFGRDDAGAREPWDSCLRSALDEPGEWQRHLEPRYGERGYTGGFFAATPSAQRGYERRGRFAGRGPKGYRRSDERLREEACDLLTDDPEIDASEVTVTVKDGAVTLEGSVPERRMKRDAGDCIEAISGVRQVHNRLRIEPMEGCEQGRGAASAERMGAYSGTGASEGQRTAGKRRTTH